MTVEFTVEGMVKPKERPRTRQINGHIQTYTPKGTREYELRVKAAYPGFKTFTDGEYLSVHIDAYYPIPKSTSNANRVLMLSGRVRPTKRPDLDNIAKSICDALNGVAYKDDSQIVKLTVAKYYSDVARAEIRISEVNW